MEEPSCKVGEVIERNGLETADPRYESLNDGLVRRWTGADDHAPMGYRPLTDWFNKRLLRRVYDEHGRDALGERVDHDYDVLTSDDGLVREEIVESLEADGIDGAAVREAMVSWGTMRIHLKQCLDAEKGRETESSDWERDSVSMARSFATEKVERALSALANKKEFDGLDDVSVSIQIQLACDHCPTQVPFEVALDRGYVCEQHTGATERNS